MKVRLYYANELIKEWDFFFILPQTGQAQLHEISREILYHLSPEFYNGGYLRILARASKESWPEWMRCDITPTRIEDVPKGLRMLDLIMGD
jgi:hypothetical protein